jgi:hypothetical protein
MVPLRGVNLTNGARVVYKHTNPYTYDTHTTLKRTHGISSLTPKKPT